MVGKKVILSGTAPMSADQLNSLIEGLCAPTIEFQNSLSTSLKSIYDNSVAVSSTSYGPFQQLVVDGIDPDSIWEEIRSRNEPLTQAMLDKLTFLVDAVDDDDDDNDDDDDDDGDGDGDDDDEGENVGNNDSENDEDDDDDDDDDDDVDDDDDDDENDIDDDADGEEENYEEETAPPGPLTEDEEGDMEEYLDELEREEMRRDEKNARKLQNRSGHKGVLEVNK